MFGVRLGRQIYSERMWRKLERRLQASSRVYFWRTWRGSQFLVRLAKVYLLHARHEEYIFKHKAWVSSSVSPLELPALQLDSPLLRYVCLLSSLPDPGMIHGNSQGNSCLNLCIGISVEQIFWFLEKSMAQHFKCNSLWRKKCASAFLGR